MERKITVLQSDLFAQIPENTKFDIVFANLPFRNKVASDIVAASQWDTNFNVHKRFFGKVTDYLRKNGVIYMPHGNYPELVELFELIEQAGMKYEEIARMNKGDNDPRMYYTYKIWR